MEFEWNEKKNQANIRVHEIDFHDAWRIFDYPMIVKTDTRKDYGEQRLVGLGQLDRAVVVAVFTKRGGVTRIISIRRANRNERKIYEDKCKKQN